MNTAKPAMTFRDGAVSASVWLRQTRAGVFYDVTFARSWKDPQTGKVGSSLNFSDLHLDSLIDLACHAKDWIVDKKASATFVRLGEDNDPQAAD